MEYKTACPKCREIGGDVAGDNFHVYGSGKGGLNGFYKYN